jgi:hypothetical protein
MTARASGCELVVYDTTAGWSIRVETTRIYKKKLTDVQTTVGV